MNYSNLQFNWKLGKTRNEDHFPDDDINSFGVYSEVEEPLRRRRPWLIAKHIFIETPRLYDFLTNTRKTDISFKDYTNGVDFYDYNPYFLNITDEEREEYPYDPDEDQRRADLIFHHQASDVSFCVSIQFMKKTEKFGIYVTDGTHRMIFHDGPDSDLDTTDEEQQSIMNIRNDLAFTYVNSSFEDIFSEETWYDPMSQMARIALNYLLYSSCFPEMVSEGFPEGFTSAEYTGKDDAKKLAPAPQILSSTRSTPHNCLGYFQTLQDEHSSKMPGKTTFVKVSW